MSYKHHTVTGIRKMKWDQLWHVLYEVKGKERWDRVSKKEALSLTEGGTVIKVTKKGKKSQ
jgi:hypothetical protein